MQIGFSLLSKNRLYHCFVSPNVAKIAYYNNRALFMASRRKIILRRELQVSPFFRTFA